MRSAQTMLEVRKSLRCSLAQPRERAVRPHRIAMTGSSPGEASIDNCYGASFIQVVLICETRMLPDG